MRVGDDGEADRVRHAPRVRLAVGGEGEHRLEEPLELERRADLAAEAGPCVAGVAEAVHGARLDGDDLSGAGDDLRAPVPELERALEHLEALALVRVDVRGGDGAVGDDADLDLDELAVGLGGGLQKADLLAGDGVLDGLAGADGGGHRVHFRVVSLGLGSV